MREQLLGYLLGALEPEEREQIAARLAEDPELREELDELRARVAPLGDDDEHFEPPSDLATRTVQYVSLRAGETQPVGSSAAGWRWVDLAVASGIMVAAGMLVFPAVANSRHHARLHACQENLHVVGRALLDYSLQHEGRFPSIPGNGNTSVAGFYAPQLFELGFLTDARHLVCPASQLAEEGEFRLPTAAEIEQAVGDELAALQRRIGGSYGYSLGYVSDGRRVGVCCQLPDDFPVMSDAPLDGQASRDHGPCGQNVLLRDGSVRFWSSCNRWGDGDNIYLNEQGIVGAGVGPHDAVIGASNARPIVLETVSQ